MGSRSSSTSHGNLASPDVVNHARSRRRRLSRCLSPGEHFTEVLLSFRLGLAQSSFQCRGAFVDVCKRFVLQLMIDLVPVVGVFIARQFGLPLWDIALDESEPEVFVVAEDLGGVGFDYVLRRVSHQIDGPSKTYKLLWVVDFLQDGFHDLEGVVTDIDDA